MSPINWIRLLSPVSMFLLVLGAKMALEAGIPLPFVVCSVAVLSFILGDLSGSFKEE